MLSHESNLKAKLVVFFNLKVAGLTPIIAGSAVARGLAELRASIMGLIASYVPDLGYLYPDLSSVPGQVPGQVVVAGSRSAMHAVEFGRATGNDEPVTPVFPNSGYSTGIIGVSRTLDASLQCFTK
ncbi:hypothetical protein DL95DRAFT_406756 [Leptodontidium sp. 2 PMI_412]|nr:hypothetical protein DL95DRAFT_406756 [Leptodontidium sp. 2 PMI_412]